MRRWTNRYPVAAALPTTTLPYRLCARAKRAALVCLTLATLVVPTATGATTDRPTTTDARCMRLIEANQLPLDSAKADWVANYHGCQQVYADGWVLVGYGRGTSACDRLAYRLTLLRGYQGEALHRRMAGRCVLYEDWAWGAE